LVELLEFAGQDNIEGLGCQSKGVECNEGLLRDM
jgi:hypothetical protein